MAAYRIRTHGVGAKEASPEDGSPPPGLQSPVYHVAVTDRGRLVLPVEIREKLKIKDGDKVAVAIETDGSISVTTKNVAISMLRGMFKHLRKPGEPLASDQLIAERRREARMEDREFRELSARLRRRK